jgi:pyruvate,water dikinase
LNPIARFIVNRILPKARKAVARREQTKAWSIGIQYQFKKAYRKLGQEMANTGLLSSAELIFFLKHEEIGQMLASGEFETWNTRAEARKKLYPEMNRLTFADLSFGIPVPQEEGVNTTTEGSLTGIPVSRGLVEGKVRLVNSLADARLLKRDEIMVARFTDIGWTPFYNIIAGLITEIGSPLSHGAVVAREYGLPAVVSMKGAMNNLSTGQKIRLDAIKGEVTVL